VAPLLGESPGDPVMLAYPRTASGLGAPVTMTEADVIATAVERNGAGGAVIEGVRPMWGAKGVSSLLSAIAAGATMVLAPPNLALVRRPPPASVA
jgi:hypothetical protein